MPDERTGKVLRLGRDDLRLSDAEAKALVRSVGIELTETEIHSLNERCEGWATGIYLLALAGDVTAATSNGALTSPVDRFVVDYFRLELLDGLAPDTRNFLQQASVLDRMTSSLCDAVLRRSNSAETLRSLAHSVMFVIQLDDEGETYKLHELFRAVLQSELARLAPDYRLVLLQRAREWYEAHGEPEPAIECALATGDGDVAAELVASVALSVYWSGRVATVERWLTALDNPKILVEHGSLAVLGAAIHALRARPAAAERWARATDEIRPDLPMPDGSPAAAWVAALRSLLCADGVAAMRADAERALEQLAPDSRLVPTARLAHSYALLLSGDVPAALDSLRTTIDNSLEHGASASASVAAATVSLLLVQRGELREAEEQARRAGAIVDDATLGNYLTSAAAFAASARVAVATRKPAAAREALAVADRLVPQLTYAIPWLAVFVRLQLAHTQLALENPARTRELLGEIDAILSQRPDLGMLDTAVADLRRQIETGRSEEDGWSSRLTPAELRLLPLLSTYLSFREIADKLEISRNTVKTQAIAVYRKLDVSSRSEAVDRAQELGLLSTPKL
jgi:LuxR family maltose regulon positive regulatory protein